MDQFFNRQTVSRLRGLATGNEGRLNWILVALLGGIALLVGSLLAFLTPVGGVAVIIAGLGALLMLRDVRWGLLALIAVSCLLPFASLPFKIGFTPTFLDLVFAALYAVWAMRLITRTQDDLMLTPLGLPVLVFCLLAVFCFLLGLGHSRPTPNDLRTFAEVLMGIAIFFLAINNVRDETLLRQLTAALILAGVAEALVGIVFYFLPQFWTVRLLNPLGRLGYPVGLGALRYINDDPNRPMRAIGTNIDPNILGALLVIIVGLAGIQLFAKRPVLPRAWLILSLAVMGVCQFLTYSRGSMFGVVAALGIMALLRYRRLFWVLVIAGVLLLALPQTQAYISHFIQGIEIADRSTQMRMGEYKDAFKLIERYPWIGVGFVGTPDIDLYLGVASIYFTLASQMGLLGLGSFVLVMIVFFFYVWQSWRALPRNAALEPILLGYATAVLGSLLSGFLDHTLFTYPHATALFWLSLGLGAAAARLGRRAVPTLPEAL
jgi:O-antigen ligase